MSYIAERRQEEKERRRAEILDAAEAVAATTGWDAMTMDQVARQARLSRALLYVYFKDKTDLMFGIGQRAMMVLKQRFAESIARNRRGLEQVEGMGRAYLAFSQEFPVYFAVVSRCELSSTDPSQLSPNEAQCMQLGDEVQNLLVTAIENGFRDGSIRAEIGDAKEIAVVLWGFTHGVIQLATNKANVLAHRGLAPGSLMTQALALAKAAIAART